MLKYQGITQTVVPRILLNIIDGLPDILKIEALQLQINKNLFNIREMIIEFSNKYLGKKQ